LDTKEKIIDAAFELFSTKGYLGTTTKEIAQHANVCEVTVFRHFGTKEGIFDAVLRANSILPEFQKITVKTDDLSLEETLNVITKKLYFTLVNKKKFIRIILSELNQYSEKVIEIYKNFIEEMDELLVNILEKKQKKYPLKNIDIKIAVKGFIGMIFSYFQINEIFLDKKISTQEIDNALSTFVQIFLRGIEDI